MASPIVAGVAALVKAKNPALTPKQIAQQVKDTGVRNRDLNVNRIDARCAVFNILTCTGQVPSAPELDFVPISPE